MLRMTSQCTIKEYDNLLKAPAWGFTESKSKHSRLLRMLINPLCFISPVFVKRAGGFPRQPHSTLRFTLTNTILKLHIDFNGAQAAAEAMVKAVREYEWEEQVVVIAEM